MYKIVTLGSNIYMIELLSTYIMYLKIDVLVEVTFDLMCVEPGNLVISLLSGDSWVYIHSMPLLSYCLLWIILIMICV